MRRSLLAVPVVLLLLAAGAWLLWSPSSAPDPARSASVDAVEGPLPREPGQKKKKGKGGTRGRPNVLVIVWDTVRADRMQLYGHDRANTPNLVRFAEKARVFDNAIAPATWTVPSHASLFTGLPVTTHGANARWRWLDHHHTTLAEVLRDNGYATYAFSANPYLSGLTNLLQGFDVKRLAWEDKKRAASFAKAKLIEGDASTEISPAYAGGPDVAWDNAPFKEAAELANQDLTTWLLQRKHKKKPWFAFVNLMEAHSPRIPRLETRRQLLEPAVVEQGLKTDVSLWREVSAILGQHRYRPEEIEGARGVYDATIHELDAAFGELMQQMEDRGALDRTIVVLTSDHGESLGEHGLWEHRYGVWQTLVHVPLIIRYPKGLAPGRTEAPVSTANIMPTVLDLLDLEGPDGLGPSLAHADRPQVVTQLTDPYSSKLGPFRKAYPNVDFSPFLRAFDAWIEGDLKLVRSSDGDHALFDLAHDPGELRDLYDSHPDASRLLGDLEDWRHKVPTYDPGKRVEADHRKGHGSKAEREAMQEMLGALGYLEDDEGL